MEFRVVLFIVGIISNSLIIIGLLISILKPKYRIWPPPRKNSWQFIVSWIFIYLSYLSIILLGIFDWDSFLLIHYLRFPFGIAFIFIGLGLFYWGIRTLSLHSSYGLEGEFITSGPYKFTRNPQYLGDILFFMGLIIVTNSLLTLIVVVICIIWNVLTPFSEEPWLRNLYGAKYDEYCKKVRRFI